MRKQFCLAAVSFAAVMVTALSVQALPVANLAGQSDQLIQVRQGCGLGFHRGPLGGCQPNVAPRGPFGRNACWFERGPFGGMHRVCR
jgi:hypothetical protein